MVGLVSTDPAWQLGIDPGANGAAVLVGPSGRPVVAWAWLARTREGRRAFEVAIVQGGDRDGARIEIVPSMHDLGILIIEGARRVAGTARIDAAIESQHVAKSVKATILLARSAGEIIGPMRVELDEDPWWVSPSEWRELLAIPKGTEPLKVRTLRAAVLVSPLAEALRRRAARVLDVEPERVEGIIEAWIMARWRRSSCPKAPKKRTRRARSSGSSGPGARAKRTPTSAG